jgi:DNA-binding NarL/FixJ family response regulator
MDARLSAGWAHTATPQPARPRAPLPAPARLSGAHLLALQLLARAYSEDQISELTDRRPETVRALVAEAAEALDAKDTRAAVTAARQRGLIV